MSMDHSMHMMMMNTTAMDMDMDMDHSMSSMHSMGDCPMIMYFHWTITDCVLFEWWHPQNWWQFLLTLIVLFLMTFFREFMIYVGKWYELKHLHVHEYKKVNRFWVTNAHIQALKLLPKETPLQSLSPDSPSMNSSAGDGKPAASRTDLQQPVMAKTGDIWYNDGYPMKLRIADGLFFLFSLVMGYWVMLVVMTYNWSYFITVCVGFLCGRVVFYGQTKNLQVSLSLNIDQDDEIAPTESCH